MQHKVENLCDLIFVKCGEYRFWMEFLKCCKCMGSDSKHIHMNTYTDTRIHSTQPQQTIANKVIDFVIIVSSSTSNVIFDYILLAWIDFQCSFNHLISVFLTFDQIFIILHKFIFLFLFSRKVSRLFSFFIFSTREFYKILFLFDFVSFAWHFSGPSNGAPCNVSGKVLVIANGIFDE